MITDRQTFVIQQSLLPMKQAEKIKSCKMKEAWMKNDEGWMKIDEGWMKIDEGWMEDEWRMNEEWWMMI